MGSSASNFVFADFIHQCQKERGLVSLYLRSPKDDYMNELEQQFRLVDALTEPIEQKLEQIGDKASELRASIKFLQPKRKYVVARIVSPQDIINFYSRDVIKPMIDTIGETLVLDNANNPRKVSSFIHFLQWKERVGQERAIGTQLISPNWECDAAFRNRLEFIQGEERAYERMFLALATPDQIEQYNLIKSKSSSFDKIDKIHKAIESGNIQQLASNISASEWFDVFSAKMDILHDISKLMASGLSKSEETSTTTKPVPAPARIEISIQKHLSFIQSLPLFAGVEESELAEILKHSRINEYPKGTHIFMQGEQSTRFYVILEGWVKIFKGNSEGAESVLQVMNSGECLLETSLLNNSVYPVTAQAVEKVKLLSIPSSIVREKIKSSKDLAINMLSTVANRSQSLITQFEQLTLKSVNQRVGWFLLKLFLDKGDNSNTLKLPFDKSLIAAYLGMKPETFSRTLQSLRDYGVEVEKGTVKLHDIYTLCNYCDSDLAGHCQKHETNSCPNPGAE